MRDENSGGTECFTIINGSQKVYTPAFQKDGERNKMEGLTKDSWILPRGPLPKNLVGKESAFNSKSTNPEHEQAKKQIREQMRKHFDEGRNLAEKYGNIMDKIGKISSTPKT